MEQMIRVSVFLGFFSSFFCREGIRVSDKRVASAAQIGNAGQVSGFFFIRLSYALQHRSRSYGDGNPMSGNAVMFFGIIFECVMVA
jgi:hypothetical protein